MIDILTPFVEKKNDPLSKSHDESHDKDEPDDKKDDLKMEKPETSKGSEHE